MRSPKTQLSDVRSRTRPRPPSRDAEAALSPEEREFLRRAREKFRADVDWFEFETFAFGSRSPLFSRTRSHRDVLASPLYIALKEMWLMLGTRQGHVAEEPTDAARRKATGRRAPNHR